MNGIVMVVLRTAALLAVLGSGTGSEEPIPVRYAQGSSHGFVVLKTLEGKTIAMGETTQTVRGDRVMSRLFFAFVTVRSMMT